MSAASNATRLLPPCVSASVETLQVQDGEIAVQVCDHQEQQLLPQTAKESSEAEEDAVGRDAFLASIKGLARPEMLQRYVLHREDEQSHMARLTCCRRALQFDKREHAGDRT